MTQRSDGEGTVTIPPGATVTGVRTKVDRTTTHDETFVYLRTVVAAEPGDVITLVFPHAPGPHPEEPLIAVPVTVPSPPPDTHTVELGAACGEQDVAHNLWLFFRARRAPSMLQRMTARPATRRTCWPRCGSMPSRRTIAESRYRARGKCRRHRFRSRFMVWRGSAC